VLSGDRQKPQIDAPSPTSDTASKMMYDNVVVLNVSIVPAIDDTPAIKLSWKRCFHRAVSEVQRREYLKVLPL